MTFIYSDQEWGVPNEYREEHDRLWKELVPAEGPCTTVNGEMLRAAAKICHDYFNNGWGCNNWSGAVNYLYRIVSLRNQSPQIIQALNHVDNYSHGEPVRDGDYDSTDANAEACFVIMKAVLEYIMNNPEPVPNKTDMWDLQEDDYRHSEDDYGEYEDA